MEALLEKYKIIEQIGEGTFGTVFLAKEIKLNRKVVLKILQPHEDKEISKRDLKRYVARVKKFANLKVEGLVQYHELISPDEKMNKAAVISDYLRGANLREFLRDEEVSNKDLVKVMIEAAHVLQGFHEEELYHGNIRPTNIFVHSNFTVTLTDPGLDDCDNMELEAPSLFYSNTLNIGREMQHLAGSFISVIMRQYSAIFEERTSEPGKLSHDETLEEMRRNFKIILVSRFADLLFDTVGSNPYKRPDSMVELIKELKKVLKASDRKVLSAPLKSNNLIYVPKKTKAEDEFDPTSIEPKEGDGTKIKKRKEKLKIESLKIRKEKNENTNSCTFKRKRGTHSRADDDIDLDSLRDRSRFNVSIVVTAIAIVILFISVKNGGIDKIFSSKQNQQKQVNVGFTIYSEDLKVVAYAIDQNNQFNKKKIYARLKKIDALLEKNKDKPEYDTYINKKIELIEIASVSDSEFLVHRVLDDIENEIDSI